MQRSQLMRHSLASLTMATVLATSFALAACGDDDDDDSSNDASGDAAATPVIDPGDGGNYTVDLDPADFVDRIDNPYLPFTPGSTWVYESEDGEERIEIEVLEETRDIAGISATIVRDVVYEEGEIVEDTFDWYAQDRDGNVWYLGEDSTEFEDGEPVSTAGSWEHGVDGALAGIIMQASPAVGQAYRQEYYEDEAVDMAEIQALDESREVAAGSYDQVLRIREWTPLEPEVVEDKFYAPGVGAIFEEKVAGEDGSVELIAFTPTP